MSDEEKIVSDECQHLLDVARRARLHAFAPYSGFLVGAAMLAEDGRVFSGCNVENATYGLTMCAERVALLKAISEGARKFSRIAVVADSDNVVPPCGACRQLLWEFAGNIEVILGNLTDETGHYEMKDLFPLPFDERLVR